MLERTAGCLESGSLRRVLPGSRSPLKSRRSLHSTFWTHGAADIELSPLWSALVRGPDRADQQHEPDQILSSAGGMLLEFLYPTRTLSIVRQYSAWGDRTDRNRSTFGLSRLGHRLYTSTTKATSSNDNYGTLDTSEVEFIHKKPIELKHLLGLDSDHDYEEAWQQYHLQDEVGRRQSRIALIKYLAASKTILEAERVVELFKAIPEEERTSDMRGLAIQSYLRLRNSTDAIELHQSSMAKHDSLVGSADIMAYLIEHSMWSRAFSIYREVSQFRVSRTNVSYNVFEVVRTIPKFHVHAANLVAHVDHVIKGSSATLTSEWQSFALKIVRQAMFSTPFEQERFQYFISVFRKWRKQNTPQIYHDAVEYLLDLKQGNLAVRLYRNSRQELRLKYPRKILHALLRTFCTHHSILGMQQVLDDFFRFYKGPTILAYKLCIREFASMGDADTVYALFEQRERHYPKEDWLLGPDDLSPLLNVHAKRGELQEVVKRFGEITSTYGFKPDLLCCNILLHAYAKVNDVEGAFACFEDIYAAEELNPDAYTFGTLMGVCVSNGDLERTIEVYRLADSMKVKKNVVMLDLIVLAYIQDDRLAQAEKICEEGMTMQFDGSPTRMWNYLLVAYAMRRDLANVNRILRRMSELNIEYDALTYGALMQALAMVRQPERAYTILREVMKEAGTRPTHFHYAIVMAGFIATREFGRVFNVHNRMNRRNLRQSASTKLVTVKAAFQIDTDFKDGSEEDRAYRLFNEVVRSLDPSDIATTTWKGTGGISAPDVAYPTMFFSYALFILAQRSQHLAVTEVYKQYVELLPERTRKSVPIGILSALIVSRNREADFKGVQECWDLAFSEAKSQGRRTREVNISSSSARAFSEPQIVHNRQLELQVIFTTYANALIRQGKVDDLTMVVNEIAREGLTMSNKNWNQYIGLLAENNRFKEAFTLSESKLMPGWTGWAHIRWTLPERNRLPFEIRAIKKEARFYRPKYHTLLFLAKAWLQLQTMAAESRGLQMMLSDIERDSPKTVQAIASMQRLDDALERSVLQEGG